MGELEKVTDLTFLKSFTGGQSEKMSKYIRMFLTGAPQNISQMELHALNKDWTGVYQSAHSLKPQLGYFGAKASEELLKQIPATQIKQNIIDIDGDNNVAVQDVSGKVTIKK